MTAKSEAVRLIPLPCALILLCGLGLNFYLWPLASQGAFFSGDMGLKYLQSMQFIERGLVFDLVFTLPDFAAKLYAQGLYPFAPPFVFEHLGSHYSQYPPLFPLLSAPWLATFGLAGLYVLPILSLVCLWLTFLAVARGLGLDQTAVCLGLAALVLASPLTVYGSMFWEHAPACSLAYAGLYPLLGRSSAKGWPRAFAGGLLMGLAVFFRPEYAVFGPLCLIFLALFAQKTFKARLFPAVCGLGLAFSLFLGLNQLIFAQPLGIHGLQYLRGLDPSGHSHPTALADRLANAASLGLKLYPALCEYFPLALGVPLAWLLSRKRPRLAGVLLALALGLCLAVPFILPPEAYGQKQWGPRFLFAVLPPFCLSAALLWRALGESGPARKILGSGLLLLCLGLGALQNTVAAAREIGRDYQDRVLPSLRYLQGAPQRAVAVGLQHIAQELAVLTGSKIFFLAPDAARLKLLARTLREQGESGFIYIRHVEHPSYDPAGQGFAIYDEQANLSLGFALVLKQAKYELYSVGLSSGN